MTLPIQKEIEGKYEILEKIGEGGIGSVYKVKHRLLEEVRVIKVLRPQVAAQEDLQRRFLREAKMAIRLKHQNIAQLHDFAVTGDNTAYIVMEFIDGIALDAMLKTSGPPSVDLTLEISRQALEALGYLHHHKFVHRDISPDNLMLATSFDGNPLVKLIDLGIAKNLEAKAQLTQTGVFLGKVRYSSPEQFSGQSGEDDLDHRSDIYSFGVMLYELLTGEYPFLGESFTELAGSHLFQAPRPFSETDPEGKLPDGLRKALLEALEKEPEKRFDTAKTFAAALAEFRDPECSLATELEQAVEVTTSSLPGLDDLRSPGSTQNRLNQEFGLVTTPSPQLISEITGGKTTAPPASANVSKAARQTADLIAAGKLAKAETALADARASFGDDPALDQLQLQLDKARKAAGKKPVAATATTGVPKIAWAAGAAALILVGGSLWFLVGRGDGTVDTAALTPNPAKMVEVEATERFDPTRQGETVFAPNVEPPPVPGDIETKVPVQQPPPQDQQPLSSAGGPQPGGPGDPGPTQQGVGAEGDPPAQESPPPELRLSSETFQPGVGVVAPVLISVPDAVYPGGKPPKNKVVVVIEVLVSEHGTVLGATVTKGPSFKRKVRDAALEAARGAKFQPAVREGVAGRMRTDVLIVFSPE